MPNADDAAELASRLSGPRDAAAPAIVLLHGLGDSGDCWPDAVGRWGHSRSVVGLDALGHGRSPRFTPAQLSAPDPLEEMYATSVAAVERVAGESGPVLLVAHSMGAGVATALAARRPDLVRAAVLEEPAWRDPADRVQDARTIAERIADCRRFVLDPQGSLADGRRDNPGWPQVEFGPWARAKTEVDLEFLALGVASFAVAWEDFVREIRVPTLVLIGERSELLPESTRRRAAALANDAVAITVVSGAGHCVRRDLPEVYHGLVDPWLAAHS